MGRNRDLQRTRGIVQQAALVGWCLSQATDRRGSRTGALTRDGFGSNFNHLSCFDITMQWQSSPAFRALDGLNSSVPVSTYPSFR
jgi:hypothetical protein